MYLLLHIETATDICSVGISRGKEVLSLHQAAESFSHTAQLTLLINACMQESGYSLQQLDAIAISQGPGSYTSLRVGASAAKAICYALDKPLLAIDTLSSLALASKKEKFVPNALYCPMIDNRRMEVLTSLFDENLNRLTDIESKIITKDSFAPYFDTGQHILFSGNGAEKCKTLLSSKYAIFTSVVCSAAHLVPLALQAIEKKQFADVAYFEPLYIKPPNITTARQRL